MGSKTRLGSYCTKRANNGVNLATSRNIYTRLARPIAALPTAFMDVAALLLHLAYYIQWTPFIRLPDIKRKLI